MDAFLFTLALFSFWGLVGFATVSAFQTRLRVVQGVLVSPAIGIAVTILPVFFINRAGIPVKDFGAILLPVLAVIAATVLAIKRPLLPIKQLLPFIAVLVAALFFAARPMFSYGFDWVSFSNDDMANYCLGAQRFLNHGFFDKPNLSDLYGGKDYSLAYWFMHVAGKSRSGSELMLSTVWAFSGLNAHQVFMPVIMALHLALVAGVGAMVADVGNTKRTPLIAMGLMAISPLTSLGALYQLIGQVGGLALLTAAATLMYRTFSDMQFFSLTRASTPAALVFSAIFVWYPEVLPFFGVGWLLYIALLFNRSKHSVLKVALPALVVGLTTLLVLNKYVIASVIFMLGQASGGMHSADLSTVLFPYFLVPSGIAAIWGLTPIAGNIREPFASLAIAGGLVLFYWVGRRVIPKQIQKVTTPISMLLVMTAMGLLLFYRNNDFGLFKLAMFVQPFLIGVVAIELGRLKWNGTTRLMKTALPLVLVAMAISQFRYVAKSTGEIFGGLNEIPRASALKVNRQFQKLFEPLRGKNADGFIADTSNIVLAKYQSLYSHRVSLIFPSRDFFVSIVGTSPKNSLAGDADAEKTQFVEHRIQTDSGVNTFHMIAGGAPEISKRTLITTREKQTIFNAAIPAEGSGYFQYLKAPQNHLLFIHSDRGNHYYFGDRGKIAFYSLENDPMFPGQKFSALGEHLLFLVLGPTKKLRVEMELTDTVVKQFGSELPKPRVQSTSLNFTGRGTGRIFSDPIEPTIINGMSFVSIDMARNGRLFPNPIKGLMLLYGRDIPADQRLITAFGRDISLISEEQYQTLQPPINLNRFPNDLGNKNLEYSGIYEDGWISEHAFFVLAPSPSTKVLSLKGEIPQIDSPSFSTVVTLSINGKPWLSQKIGLGSFELNVPVNSLQGKQRVDISFSNHQQLPGADGRIIGGKIEFIGFK